MPSSRFLRIVTTLLLMASLGQHAIAAPHDQTLEKAKASLASLLKELGDAPEGQEGVDWWVAEVEPRVDVRPYFLLEVRYREPGRRPNRIVMSESEIVAHGDAGLLTVFKTVGYPARKMFTARELIAIDQALHPLPEDVVWKATKSAPAPRLDVTPGNGRRLVYCLKSASGLQRRTVEIGPDGAAFSRTEPLSR